MTDELRPLSVECPWCKAPAGETCGIVTPKGKLRETAPHPSRLRAASEIPVQENRPTLTPKPNRPDRTLDQ